MNEKPQDTDRWATREERHENWGAHENWGVREEFKQTLPTIILVTIIFGGLGFIIQGVAGGVISTFLVFFAAAIVAASKG